MQWQKDDPLHALRSGGEFIAGAGGDCTQGNVEETGAMKEIHWLCAMGVAMLVGALLIFAGWMLGRQGINKRVIVSGSAVHVAPAQSTIHVAPPVVHVAPPSVSVEMPATPAPTVIFREAPKVDEPTKVEPKKVAKSEPTRVEPMVVVHPPMPAPVKRDIDEYGELLPPPKK